MTQVGAEPSNDAEPAGFKIPLTLPAKDRREPSPGPEPDASESDEG